MLKTVNDTHQNTTPKSEKNRFPVPSQGGIFPRTHETDGGGVGQPFLDGAAAAAVTAGEQQEAVATALRWWWCGLARKAGPAGEEDEQAEGGGGAACSGAILRACLFRAAASERGGCAALAPAPRTRETWGLEGSGRDYPGLGAGRRRPLDTRCGSCIAPRGRSLSPPRVSQRPELPGPRAPRVFWYC